MRLSRSTRLLLGRTLPLAALGLAACATARPAAPVAAAPPSGPAAVHAIQAPNWGIVIHGGAGTIARSSMTPEQEAEYRTKLTEALMAGHRVLAAGGASLDAVQAAINVMEDSPLFNAGKGAVFTHEGKNELDAAVMDGRTLAAGAVAGVTTVKNPINLARAVMEKSRHVMLMGAGAEAFAKEQGIELVPASYFFTERRWQSLEKARADEAKYGAEARLGPEYSVPEDRKFGTVGAVALDKNGNLAAGTSTGGVTNKRWGRVGDAPIIGSGTYANNNSCAVSATGTGEYFIRATVAHDICARVEYLGLSLAEAADQVVMKKLVEMGGDGGIIAMDARGNVAMPFNTSGMYRGRVGADGRPNVQIYRD